MPDQPSNNVASDAVVVSIAEYPYCGGLLRSLPGAAKDSQRVRNWLTSHAPGIDLTDLSWPSSQAGGAQDPWNRYKLDGVMQDLFVDGLQKMKDRLFVYISGHGRSTVQDPAMPAVYCAQYTRLIPDLFAPAGWIRLFAAAPLYREYLFFFDCCNEAQPGQPPPAPAIEIKYRDDHPSVLVVAACSPNQQALETATGGVFTEVLLEALSGSAGSPGSDWVTAGAVVDYLKENVPIRANEKKPGHGQTPKEWFDSTLHADLKSFRLFQREKITSIDVSTVVDGHAPADIGVLGFDLDPVGALSSGGGGAALLEGVFPGRYVLRGRNDGWQQGIRVKTSVSDDGSVSHVVERIALG